MSFNSLFRDQLQLISKIKIWQFFFFWKFEESGKPALLSYLIKIILYLHESHNTPLSPSPLHQNLHRNCFRFHLVHLHVPGETFGAVKEVYYGICEGREWLRTTASRKAAGSPLVGWDKHRSFSPVKTYIYFSCRRHQTYPVYSNTIPLNCLKRE